MRTMSKGGVLVNVQEWGGVFQFSGGRMTSRRQCACEIPPFRKSCIRACYLCKILGNQPLRPPNQSVPIRLWRNLWVRAQTDYHPNTPCKHPANSLSEVATPTISVKKRIADTASVPTQVDRSHSVSPHERTWPSTVFLARFPT